MLSRAGPAWHVCSTLVLQHKLCVPAWQPLQCNALCAYLKSWTCSSICASWLLRRSVPPAHFWLHITAVLIGSCSLFLRTASNMSDGMHASQLQPAASHLLTIFCRPTAAKNLVYIQLATALYHRLWGWLCCENMLNTVPITIKLEAPICAVGTIVATYELCLKQYYLMKHAFCCSLRCEQYILLSRCRFQVADVSMC